MIDLAVLSDFVQPPLVLAALIYFWRELKVAHKRISAYRDELRNLELEVAKEYASKDHLDKYVVGPITARLITIEEKIDFRNGKST